MGWKTNSTGGLTFSGQSLDGLMGTWVLTLAVNGDIDGYINLTSICFAGHLRFSLFVGKPWLGTLICWALLIWIGRWTPTLNCQKTMLLFLDYWWTKLNAFYSQLKYQRAYVIHRNSSVQEVFHMLYIYMRCPPADVFISCLFSTPERMYVDLYTHINLYDPRSSMYVCTGCFCTHTHKISIYWSIEFYRSIDLSIYL